MGGIHVVDINALTTGQPITYREDIHVTLSSINTRSIERDGFGNIWIGNYSTGVDFIAANKQPFHTLPNYDQSHQTKRIYGVTSDRKDRVWLGGEDELQMSIDGKIVKSWNISKAMNRSHSFIMCLMADSHDNIWLGVEDDGVVKFNTITEQMERIDIGHPVSDIRAFYEDRDGKIWIGSEFGVYTFLDGKVEKPAPINDVLGHSVAFGFIEKDSLLLTATYAHGLVKFNRQTGTWTELSKANGLPSINVNHILLDRQGCLWAATPEGLTFVKDFHHLEDAKTYNENDGLTDRHIRAIQEDRSGRIWVSTYSGIACFDRQKEQFYRYDHLNGLPPGSFIAGSATTLSDGTMYFGSPTGVCFFTPQLQNNDIKVSEAEIVVCEAYNPAGDDTEILNLMPDENRRPFQAERTQNGCK